MPFNGSGSYSLSDTIANGTPNDADELQAILDDIATAVSNAVCVDGQSTMTGPHKASNGSAAAPSLTFGSDTDTGFYRKGANDLGVSVGGALVANFDTNGLTLASGKTISGANIIVTASIADNAVTLAKLATQADATILANVSGGAAVPTAATITSVIDKVYSTQGGLLYRGAASWAGLAAGTSGQFLKTQGAGANPAWASISEVPSQSGAAGKVLSSDGTTASWSSDSSVRARCTVTMSGTTPSLETGSVNCASIVRTGTGIYELTFTNALASTNYQGFITVLNTAGALPGSVNVRATTKITLGFYTYTGAAFDPVVGFSVIVFGGF